MAETQSDTPPAQQLIQPRKDMPTIWQLLERPDTKEKFKQVLSGQITTEKMVRLCINAVRKTPRLAECDPFSVFGAMMTAASFGLEPNTPLGHAFLIPYKKRVKQGTKWVDAYDCQFQIGYKGFVSLAHRSPKLMTLQAEAIHEGDIFSHQLGSETFLKFTKSLDKRGQLRGAFCYMKLRTEFGDDSIAGILPLEEIYKIRARSETYRSLMKAVAGAENELEKKKAEAKLAETPWVMWEDDMAAKSAIKKTCKQFPLSPQMIAATRVDELAEEGTLDLTAMSDPEMARSVTEGEQEPEQLEHQPEAPMPMAKPMAQPQAEMATATPPQAANPAPQQPMAQQAAAPKPPQTVDHETGEILEQAAQQSKINFGE